MIFRNYSAYFYKILFLILLNIFLLSNHFLFDGKLLSTKSFFKEKANKIDVSLLNPKDFPELSKISENTESFDKLSDFFENLALEKGGEYAFTVLRLAEMPSGVDMHLLGHVVGDVLYKQKGLEGIYSCTQDFRNACSHSIVVGLFYDKGEEALEEIGRACRKAPGGSGAYTMCFHGLGHGVLAYADYDLEKTVGLCKKTGTKEYADREFHECVGGAVMEIIGGVHDKEAWERQYKNYLKSEKPLYPCTASFVPDEAKPMCFNYLTPHLFQTAGGSLGNPYGSFEKAFTFCDQIPLNETSNRRSCFGGFGKEFIVLARERDIRDMENINKTELNKVVDWCDLAKASDGKISCLLSAMSSLYWGGENHYGAALNLCEVIQQKDTKNICYNALVDNIFYYKNQKSDIGYLKDFCSSIPSGFENYCLQKIKRIWNPN